MIWNVRDIKFSMQQPMFSVGHLENKNIHVANQLKNI